jgi:hypothetical protein
LLLSPFGCVLIWPLWQLRLNLDAEAEAVLTPAAGSACINSPGRDLRFPEIADAPRNKNRLFRT